LILLVILGALLIAAGLSGLGYCIWKSLRIRRSGISAPDAHAQLRGLVAVNLGSVGAAAFGLAILFLGLTF
jgi:hypothetical protein